VPSVSKLPWQKVLLAVLLLIFPIVLVRTSWIGDDALITARTLRNFVHGFGPVWNMDERVQAFTHPLWLGAWLVTSAMTDGMIGAMYGMPIVLSCATVLLIVAQLETTTQACVALLFCISSRAFIDYSTAGLENPLTHFLLAAFMLVFLKRAPSRRRLFWLALLGCLLSLTRLDAILLVAPALVYAWWTCPERGGWRVIAVAFLPLCLWELFSLFYYGFPFPNTAYAKLATGISKWMLVTQSFGYFMHSAMTDPPTLVVMFGGLLVAWALRDPLFTSVAAGLFLYLVYIVKIGGDFMGGRFFSAPFLVGLALVVRVPADRPRVMWLSTLPLMVLLTFAGGTPPFLSGADYTSFGWDRWGVADERGFYFQERALSKLERKHKTAFWDTIGTYNVQVEGSIGAAGLLAPLATHYVDKPALGDPLLARLPVTDKLYWRIGHFDRVIPAGYINGLRARQNLIEDPQLHAYYDKLSFIVRGPLFDRARLLEIARMNLGKYDYLLDGYNGVPLRMPLSRVGGTVAEGTPWNDSDALVLPKRGGVLTLRGACHATRLELVADHDDEYKIVYQLGDRILGGHVVAASLREGGGMTLREVKVPESAGAEGFDRVAIAGQGGDQRYSIGALRFFDGDRRCR
jgi:arabinofuranosyltransferase